MTNDAKLQNIASAKSAPKKKKSTASLDRRKARAGWIFVAPFVIGFLLIYLPIIAKSIYYTFCEFEMLNNGTYTLRWVGIDNYRNALLKDPDFLPTLLTGLQELILTIPSIIVFSLFMAVLLNQKMAGRAVFRAIFFIPVILATGLMESINSQNLLEEYMEEGEGIVDGSGQSTAAEIVSAVDIQQLFSNMRIGQELADFASAAVNNIFNIVNRSGVQMLIFLAGLQSISPAIYESCQIDGATGWETFWKITFPMISPMILVNSVYTIIDSFTTDSNSVMVYIANAYAKPNGNVESSAMAWMYFLIVMLIIAACAGIMSAFVFYQKRD